VSPQAHDRLWPMLCVLGLLLAGAVTLEKMGRSRSGNPIRVTIDSNDSTFTDADDERSDNESRPTPLQTPPIDQQHADARTAARRGDLVNAVDLFRNTVSTHPDEAKPHEELGFWLLLSGKPTEALAELHRAALLDPKDAGVALNLGVSLSRVGELANAEIELRRALALRPGYGSAKVALGIVLRRNGAVAESIALLKEASSAGGNEDRANAFVALGRSYLSASRSQDAARAFANAIERAPGKAEIHLRVGRAYLSTGKVEHRSRAIEILNRAADLAPDLARIHSTIARVRERQGDDTAAESSYERAVQLEPGYVYARRRLLRLALSRRDFARARFHAERLLADDAQDPEHHFLAALVAARDDRKAEARSGYLKAIETANGSYPEASFNLGILEKDVGDLESAIYSYDKAIADRPNYVAALNNRGLAQNLVGRPKEAEASFREALKIDPRYPTGLLNLGELLAGQSRFDEAIDLLRMATSARREYWEAQLILGQTLLVAGHTKDAVVVLGTLVAAQPKSVRAWYAFGAAQRTAQNLEGAVASLRSALSLDAAHLDSMRVLADIENQRGNRNEAQRIYGEMVECEPGNRDARLALAKLMRSTGDTEGCRSQIRAASLPDADPTQNTINLKFCE